MPMHQPTTNQNAPFSKGQTVPEEADYVCVPCGYHHHYKPGDTFGECLSCLSGTPNGQHEEFLEGEEMWEKVTPPPTETK